MNRSISGQFPRRPGSVNRSLSGFVSRPAEVARQPHHREGHLRRAVHPAGCGALRGRAHLRVPGGGGMDSPGVGLLRGHHLDHGRLRRLRGR